MQYRWTYTLALAAVLLGWTSMTSLAQEVTLISPGADWNYLDDGTDQGTTWRETDFDDSLWSTGPAPLGYGESGATPIVTTNDFGGDDQNKHPTYYYRHTFNIADASTITNLRALVRRDDGIIAYLNNVELFRDVMPTGEVFYTNFASGTAPDDGENFNVFSLPTDSLVNGDNVVAVEIHQANETSSDIVFDMELIGNPQPEISIANPTNGQIIASSTVLIQGTALPGGENVELIEIIANGNLIGTSTNADFNVIWANVIPNDYVITALLTDSSGLTAQSDPISITVAAPPSGTLIGAGEVWKYFIGTGFVEASSPSTAWRQITFDDSSWSQGPTPIGYGENDIATLIPTSATGSGNYLSLYSRKTFQVGNPADFSSVDVEVIVDDGAVAFINGTEIGRINVPAGELLSSDAAIFAEERRTLSVTIEDPASILVPGDNVLAVHVLNGNQTSSDILLIGTISATVDTTAPLVQTLIPPDTATIKTLTTIEVLFTEDVVGVDASDLLINGAPATSFIVIAPNQYVFEFPEPPTGAVQVAWIPDSGITDTASSPNLFLGGSWSYTLDPNVEPPGLIISEFMASNNDTLNDEDGDSSDWVEIYNAGQVSGDLGGWFLTEDPNLVDMWEFPSFTMLPGQYLVVFASGKDRKTVPGQLHLDFTLRASGEFLALVDPETNIVSAFSPFPEQQTDISYGRDVISPDLVGFFETPTPGAANSNRGAGFGPEVVFSEPSRTFINSFNLILTSEDPSAEIRYVTVSTANTESDITVPTQTSSLFAPGSFITVNGTVQIRARTFLPGKLPGPIITKSYVQIDPTLADFTSDLPLIVLHNFGSGEFPSGAGANPDDGTICMVFDTKFGRSSLTNLPDTATRSGVNLRGSSTQGFPKRSYAVEFWDEFNQDYERPMLDLPEESDWVLYSPNQFDNVMLHNSFANELSNDIGQYASRTRFVEVFVNIGGGRITGPVPTGNYNGIYVLEEQIKRDNNRIDIDALQPEQNTTPEITGGYVLKVDRVDSDERTFSAGGLSLIYQDPNGIDMTSPQRQLQAEYIRDYVNAMAAAINTRNANNYLDFIDERAFIDHNLINMLTINVDAFRLSGFMHKPRDEVDRHGRVVKPGKFKMGPVWDFDRSAGSSRGDTRPYDPLFWKGQGGDTGTDWFNQNGTFSNPWYRELFRDIDFWQKYVDRYQELSDTYFSTNHINSIIDRQGAELAEAQTREAQRWTSGASDTRPRTGTVTAFGYSHTFDGTYQGELDFLKRWYADRTLFIQSEFLARPSVSSTGGVVVAGTTINLIGPPGSTVYYTLNGQDPRSPGGTVSQSALPATGPVVINSNARLVARSYDANHSNTTGASAPPLSTPWSGTREYTFVVNTPNLRITEVMYNPVPEAPGGVFPNENDFEYVEVKNIGPSNLNLNGYSLDGGISLTFTNKILLPGESAVAVAYTPAFISRYGVGPNIAGEYQRLLGNNGDDIILRGPLGEVIQSFEYDDDWHPSTDGLGFSLVIRDENGPLDDWNVATGWRASRQAGGSPGADNPDDPGIPVILVNEALTHTDDPLVDSIELYNPNAFDVDVGNWFLSDDFRTPKYQIPAGTFINAGDYRVFEDGAFNDPLLPPEQRFSLRSSGDEVFVYSGNASGELTGYVHGFRFGASLNGISFGRYITSTGAEEFVAQVTNTLGVANAGPRVGPVVISEIMYHPVDLSVNGRPFPNTRDEYVELHNISGASVPLFDPTAETNTYRLRDAVSYRFPTNEFLAAGERVLVVPFDPVNDTDTADEFRSTYSLDPSVRLFGPYGGQLGNGGDSVELIQPDLVVFYGTNQVITGVEIDRVNYDDVAPWPGAADGFGPSLQRIDESAYGNDPINWVAAVPTPLQQRPSTDPPLILGHPQNQTVIAFMSASFSVNAVGEGPLAYQWLFNGTTIPGATGSTYTIPSVQDSDRGNYSVVVINGGGSVISDNAFLDVLIPADITQQPEPISRRVGESATFTVLATSSTQISYQWRFNGVDIPGATSPLFTIPSVERSDDGIYDVVLTDAVGPVTSDPARLTVLVNPQVITIATALDVVEGSDVTLSIEVDGTTPMSYRWRRSFFTLKDWEITDSLTSFAVVSNVSSADAGIPFTVVITNEAFFTPGILSPAIILNVLPDSDGDGLSDDFEAATGLDDPNGDPDMDGVTTFDESISGTDPNDGNSYIKLSGLTASGGAAMVEFQAEARTTYSVFYKDSLSIPTWTKLTDVAASTDARTVTVMDSTAHPERYYQLVSPRVE